MVGVDKVAAGVSFAVAVGAGWSYEMWLQEKDIAWGVILLVPALALVGVATVFPFRRTALEVAPIKGVSIGAASGFLMALGALASYIVGGSSCDDSVGDMSCEGAATFVVMALTAIGAMFGMSVGVGAMLLGDLLLPHSVDEPADEG